MRQLASLLARAQQQDGFTLIEVMTAVVVLAVGLGAMFQLLIVGSHQTQTNRVRQAETSLARELVEDTRSLAYTDLTPSGIPSALQSAVANSTVSGSTLSITRAVGGGTGATAPTFNATFTACSLDDPGDGYGDHSSPPQSGGSWCPDVAASDTKDSQPDDYKRVSVTVTSSSSSAPSVQQTVLIYQRVSHGPAVTCLSTNSTCPGANQTETTGSSLMFNVTTSTAAASVQWLVNGSPPPSSEIPSGALDPYTPAGTGSSFTWDYPTPDGTYTISAQGFDASGKSGTKSSLQVSLNRHMVIPPASVTAGWNNQIQPSGGVDVQWSPSVDQDVLYYSVYRQYGQAQYTVCDKVTSDSCTDTSAPSPGTEPSTCTNTSTNGGFTGQSFTTPDTYWVVGWDTDPGTGQPRVSTSQSVQVDANLCDHPPNAPTGLTGTLSNGQMTLNWTPPATEDPDSGDSIQAWRIYRWPASGSVNFPGSRYQLVGKLDASGNEVTSFTDSSADPSGVAQDYCVTSVDDNLNESSCSGAVSG